MIFLSGLWGKALPYLIAGAVVAVAVFAIVAKLLNAGRAAERAEAGMKALQRTREANDARARASRPITHQEEAIDPNNRDTR